MPAILSGDPGTGGVSQVATAASGGGEEDSRGRIIKYSGSIIVLCRYLLSVSFIYISDPGLIFCGQPAFTEPFLYFLYFVPNFQSLGGPQVFIEKFIDGIQNLYYLATTLYWRRFPARPTLQ